MNCLWKIKVPNAVQFKIQFNVFDLEGDSFCNNDRLVTFESTQQPRSECGKVATDKVINGNTLLLGFVTNDGINAKGFDLLYTSFTFEEISEVNASKPAGKNLLLTFFDELCLERYFCR